MHTLSRKAIDGDVVNLQYSDEECSFAEQTLIRCRTFGGYLLKIAVVYANTLPV